MDGWKFQPFPYDGESQEFCNQLPPLDEILAGEVVGRWGYCMVSFCYPCCALEKEGEMNWYGERIFSACRQKWAESIGKGMFWDNKEAYLIRVGERFFAIRFKDGRVEIAPPESVRGLDGSVVDSFRPSLTWLERNGKVSIPVGPLECEWFLPKKILDENP